MNRLVWIALASAAALMMGYAQQGPDLKGLVNKEGGFRSLRSDLLVRARRRISRRFSTRLYGMTDRVRRAQDGAEDPVPKGVRSSPRTFASLRPPPLRPGRGRANW